MVELVEKKCLYYSIIASAIPVAVITAFSKDFAYIAVLVAAIASGIVSAFVYTGELLNASDKIAVTSALGYSLGYLIGISVAAITYAIRGIKELAAFGNLGVQGGYIALLILSIIISYVTGMIAFNKMIKKKIMTRKITTKRRKRKY